MSLHKTITLSLVAASIAGTSVAHADNSSSVNQGAPLLGRCAMDLLSESETVGRVQWYATCFPDRVKADMEAVVGVSLDRKTAIEFYYDFMRLERDTACEWIPRSANAFYPLFERNSGEVWHAPTDANAMCTSIPEGYKFTMGCR